MLFDMFNKNLKIIFELVCFKSQFRYHDSTQITLVCLLSLYASCVFLQDSYVYVEIQYVENSWHVSEFLSTSIWSF